MDLVYGNGAYFERKMYLIYIVVFECLLANIFILTAATHVFVKILAGVSSVSGVSGNVESFWLSRIHELWRESCVYEAD